MIGAAQLIMIEEEQPLDEAALFLENQDKIYGNNVDIKKAREMGAEAARTNIPVIKNPFPARDPRRAAWDEAWCEECGNDGMDIPDAFKSSKSKKSDDKKGD